MAIDFEDMLARQTRRERLPKATRQLMRETIQGGNFVDDIAAQIAAGRSARAQQRQINRAIGTGPWAGRTPFAQTFNPALVNPTGATPQSIVGQSAPLALGPGGTPGAIEPIGSRALAPMQVGQTAGTGTPALSSGARAALPPGSTTSQVAGLTDETLALGRGAAQTAGRAAQAAAASPVDEIVASSMSGPEALSALGGVGGAGGASGAGAASRAGGMLANVTRSSLIKGAGVAGAGYLASGIIDSMNVGGENSDFDRIISGGILGAGLGAGGALALGLGTGPVGWAALGGAALFAGGKYLFGDDTTSLEKMQQSVEETRANILEVGQMYGLDASSLDDILLQYDVSSRLYLENEDKEGMKAWMTGLTQTLPAMMLQQKQEADRYGQMIEMQAKFAPIFQSQMDRAAQASERNLVAAEDTAGLFESDHPNLAALIRQSASQSNESSQRLMAAYAQQIAMAPAANAAQFEQQQMANQLMTPVG